MGSEWTTIGAIAQVFDGPHATPKKIDDGPFFLSISSLENGKLDLSKSARISEEQFKKWTKRVTPREGDVLFSYETRLGEAALMPSGITACLGRRMGLLRPDTNKVDPRFLLFAYLGPAFQQEIRTRTNYGATVERIALKELPDFPIQIPSLFEQKAIAHILGTLDDKIELDRQMNATLEAMAQALFKSWFVDFDPVIDNALATGNPIPESLQARFEARKALGDQRKPLPEAIQNRFPDRLVFNDDLGWVPEGWEIESLENSTSTIIDHRGKTPKKLGGDWVDTGYPAISAKNIKNGRITKAESIRFVSEEMYKNWMKEELRVGDVALTSEAPLGETYFFATDRNYVLSQRLFGVRADSEKISGSYLYHWLRTTRAQADMENRATGTTVTGIKQSELKNVAVLIPPLVLVYAFSVFSDPILKVIDHRDSEAKSLSHTRDTLLPKLLSGQLRISEAERQVARAT